LTLALDTSALVAVLFGESDADTFLRSLEVAEHSFLSCVTLHETRIVTLGRRGEAGLAKLDVLIANNAIQLVSFDEGQAQLAFEAHVRFGKGRHPARLNLADCAAYALAKSMGAPLLFKGDDFRLTDITPAL
jgi:ribonuclease VapC